MKKIFALCAAAALVFSLAACQSSPDEETSTTGSTAATKPSTQATTETTAPATTAPAFQEIVLADNDDVTVKIVAVEEDNLWGYTLKAFLENKTDKKLMFTMDNVSVNGFMCDPFWATVVDSGKKANDDISFSDSDFEKNGIEAVEEITFTLRIYDNDDWMADDIFNETITIKP